MAARCRFRDWLPAASIALAVACCLCIAASAAADEPASAVPALMKLLESGRLPEQRLPAVMEMVCNRGNTRDLQVVWDWLGTPDRMSPELQRKVLDWLTDAAVTRKVRPDGDLSLINRWISVDVGHEHPELQEAAIRLAAAWTDKSVVPQLRDLAFAGDTSAEMRTTAIAGLSAIDDVTSQKALRLLARDHPSNLAKMQAISGITAFDLTAAAAAAAAVMSQGKLTQVELDQGLGDMIDAFLQRPAGPTHLAEALQTSRLSKDVAKSALRYMYSVGRSDAVLSDVLSVAAGIQVDSPPPTAEEIGRIVAEVDAHGDAARGEAIFRRKDLNCMKCHSINRAGGQIGPDLSAVGGSSPTEYIVSSILNPNLAVKEQYATRIFYLESGKLLTGIVVDRDDVRVAIRDAHGQTVTIPVADIDEEAEGQTLMPQGLTKFLTSDEVIDLAKFVSELGKPGRYGIQHDKTIQRWQVRLHPPRELTAEVPHLESLRQYVLNSDGQDWQSVYGTVSGALPLPELRGDANVVGAGESPLEQVAILRGEINVKTAGPLTIHIDSSASFQSWFNSDEQHDRTQYTVSAAAGNHYLIARVVLPVSPEGYFRLHITTPDGSPAEFEIVAGS